MTSNDSVNNAFIDFLKQKNETQIGKMFKNSNGTIDSFKELCVYEANNTGLEHYGNNRNTSVYKKCVELINEFLPEKDRIEKQLLSEKLQKYKEAFSKGGKKTYKNKKSKRKSLRKKKRSFSRRKK